MRYAIFLISCLAFSSSVYSQVNTTALSGLVSSAEEGGMEGVLVEAPAMTYYESRTYAQILPKVRMPNRDGFIPRFPERM
jgi:hypothetical protein